MTNDCGAYHNEIFTCFNYYKGHMDIIKGEGGGFSWGGVEGWGEEAYNCCLLYTSDAADDRYVV